MSDDNDLQAKIDAAVAAATEGLQAKNRELLGEVKKLKKGGDIDPAEVERLESRIEALEAEKTQLSRQVKDLTRTAETASKALEAESKFTQRLLVENGLAAELAKAGVTNPAHLKAAQAMLKDGVQIVADGDVRVAKIGDKALSEFVKEWAAGDEGKHFVQAPANNGGGAPGGSGAGAQSKTMPRSQFDSLPPAQRSEFMSAGGKLTD
jgi:phage I-like protein